MIPQKCRVESSKEDPIPLNPESFQYHISPSLLQESGKLSHSTKPFIVI
jgi:hypothetical protein